MSLNSRFVKFLFVGVLNTLFGYSIFALFIFVGIHYAIAAFLSTVAGILFNFKTTGSFVFNSSDNRLIFRFFGVYAVCYVINVACLKAFSLFQISLFVAGAILILPTAGVSFLLNKRYVFNIRGTH